MEYWKKVTWNCFGSTLLRFVTGSKNPHDILNQSDAKQTQPLSLSICNHSSRQCSTRKVVDVVVWYELRMLKKLYAKDVVPSKLALTQTSQGKTTRHGSEMPCFQAPKLICNMGTLYCTKVLKIFFLLFNRIRNSPSATMTICQKQHFIPQLMFSKQCPVKAQRLKGMMTWPNTSLELQLMFT